MVRSVINPTINYVDNTKLYEDDREYEASMYKIYLMDEEVIIALGQAKNNYMANNILFYPIYLVKKNKVDQQIGVYEIPVDEVSSILDDEGDIDVSLLGEPLLYSFVSKLTLSTDTSAADASAADTSAADTSASATDATIAVVTAAQTLEDAAKEREGFKDNKTLPWIQRFMKNTNYRIVDNEGKGDCLFAAIRDGLKLVGVNTSVADMRKTLSTNATNETFLNYKDLYEKSVEEDKAVSKEIKMLADRHNELKKQIQIEKDRNTQLAIVEQAEEIFKRHKEVKKNKAYVKSIIEEFKFIKGIKDLDMFKLRLQTCDFWGDTWAISTLERALKIKIILLSRQNFKEGDEDNVLTCGQLNDDILETNKNFEPEHYIILDYSGAHYQLITYKDQGAFTFKQVPYDIKTLVVNKCLERNAGPYYIIPDFKDFMSKNEFKPTREQQEPAFEPMQTDLYDNATTFQYYSKSLDAAAPGKGAGETVGPEGPKFYSELSKIPLWRRKLDDEWPGEFMVDGKKWLTVIHYFEGSKFKRDNPNFYSQFSLDSGSALSKEIVLAEAASSKNGKYKGELIRPKDITIDKDFFEVRKEGITRGNLEKQAAIMAKFNQNEEFKRLLMSTKKAKLNHFIRGAPPELSIDLMIVREKLLNQK